MSKNPRMYAREFRELAHIGKTTFFKLLQDPALRAQLNYQRDSLGRGHVRREAAHAVIRTLRAEVPNAALRRAARLGDFATKDAPLRGRSCPDCRRRIARGDIICRHCGVTLPAA
jgi:hypothetical protein